MVQAQGQGARKLYEITPEGRQALEPQRSAVAAVFARMGEGGDDAGRYRIRRAMENVKTALKLRAARGLDEAQTEAICAILDEAAGRIEKVAP